MVIRVDGRRDRAWEGGVQHLPTAGRVLVLFPMRQGRCVQ